VNVLVSNSRASYYVGGTEVVALRQSIELARLGHEVVELVRATDDPSEYFEDFVGTVQDESLPVTIEEVEVDAPEGNGSSWALWNGEALAFGKEATPSYLRHLRDGIDMYASHLVTDSIFIPNNAPSTLHLHGNPQESDMLIDSAMAVNGNNCIAHSDSIREWWSSRYPNKRYDVFRNGVDTNEFYADPNGARPIDVLYVGRFLTHKGIDDILHSVTPDTRLVIAGSGPYEQGIRQLIADRGLNNAELFIKPSNSELKDLYAEAKIFACPSRGKEGVLTTMLEAAASGCAIVTARGSGMTDLIANEENGLLVDPGDISQITRGIAGLLHDDQRRVALAARAQSDVTENWSWAAKGKELEGLYEASIANGQ
jgi:glycosyltransferase involved in cell wall biosynthesis